jgi:hypothetical protein
VGWRRGWSSEAVEEVKAAIVITELVAECLVDFFWYDPD